MDLEEWWAAVHAAAGAKPADAPSVWRCTLPFLTASQLREAVALGWLTPAERGAASRQAGEVLQSRFGTRRILRRLVVAATLGTGPAAVTLDVRCARCGDPEHGRPLIVTPNLPPLHLSTSALGDRAVVAIGPQSLGIDIESSERTPFWEPRRWADRVTGWDHVAEACPPNASALEVWTALEALAKTTGRGLLASNAQLDAAISDHELTWLPDGPRRVICVAAARPAPTVRVIDVPK